MLNRITLLLSLLGMMLALHLWIQKERNFDQGCWGLGTTATAAASSGCKSPELEKASVFLGVSIATWGYGFYFFMAAAAFGKLLLPASAARRCHAAAEIAVALAFPFSCYLLYVQAFVARAFCPLCVISGVLVAALFAIHAYQYWRDEFKPVPDSDRLKEIGYAATLGFIAMGSLAGLMIIVNQVGTRRFDQGENAKQFAALVGRVLPDYIESERLLEMKPVRLNLALRPLKSAEWLTAARPALGRRDGISVVMFLDPNCPGCEYEFTGLTTLAERYKDRAAFYVFPRVLWDYSLLQSQALELARNEGRYFEMWRLQFERRKPGGLQLADLEKIFTDLGLDSANLEARLAAVRPATVALREQAIAAGIDSTPTIFIEGYAVDQSSQDVHSLGRLIERASAAEQARVRTK